MRIEGHGQRFWHSYCPGNSSSCDSGDNGGSANTAASAPDSSGGGNAPSSDEGGFWSGLADTYVQCMTQNEGSGKESDPISGSH